MTNDNTPSEPPPLASGVGGTNDKETPDVAPYTVESFLLWGIFLGILVVILCALESVKESLL